MHARLQFFCERSVDPALTLDARKPLEAPRDDAHKKVRFAARPRSGMAFVAGAVV
jgi:hypothetical protein